MTSNIWTPERRKQWSDMAKDRILKDPTTHINARIASRKKLTYPERLAYDFFEKNNISFVCQPPTLCGNKYYWPDFLVGDIIIEIDGEKWHSSLEQKEYDKKRDAVIMLYHPSYKIIRIPAKQVLKNLSIIFENSDISKIDIEQIKNKIIILPKIIPPDVFCVTCNCKITKHSTTKHCSRCATKLYSLKKRKFEITKDELERLISEKTFTEIGEMFNVSNNAIKRRCIVLGIPIPKRVGEWTKTILNEKIMILYRENKTLEEISKTVNKTTEEVEYIIKKKTKIKKFTPNLNVDKEKVINMYCDGYSERFVAKECNCGKTTVRTIIKEWIKHYPI